MTTTEDELVLHGLFRMGSRLSMFSGTDVAVSAELLRATGQLWVVGKQSGLQCVEGTYTSSEGPLLPISANIDHMRAVSTVSYRGDIGVHQSFRRIVYLDRYHMNVGWTPGSKQLVLLTSTMLFVAYVEAPTAIHSAVYNSQTQNLMTGGEGEIIVWLLRRRRILEIREVIICAERFPKDVETARITTLICEDVPSKEQLVFAGCGTSVVVLNMGGAVLEILQQAHSRSITALMYFDGHSLLATGAGDGTIKLWDSIWQLQHVFVGHTADVIGLIKYPYPHLMMSASRDGTIRVWNLKSRDAVMFVAAGDSILQIGMLCHRLRFYTVSPQGVQFWQINHAHSQFTSVSSTVRSLQRVEELVKPARILALSQDNKARIISPVSGEVLTSVDDMSANAGSAGHVVAISYSSSTNFIYCLMQSGYIRLYDASHNPTKFQDEWLPQNTDLVPTVLAVLETQCAVAHEPTLSKSNRKGATTKTTKDEATAKVSDNHAAVVILGTASGFIQIKNARNGTGLFTSIKVHTAPVMSITVNLEQNRIISVGKDARVQIWAVKLTSTVDIVQALSFFLPLSPLHVAVSFYRFAVVCNNGDSGNFPLAIFDTETGHRYGHPQHLDHVSVVTGLCTSVLGWFASSARDGHIKLWSDTGMLIREISLYDPISSCVVLDRGGNLGIGVQFHFHSVPCGDFLAQSVLEVPAGYSTVDKNERPIAQSLSGRRTLLSPAAAAAGNALAQRQQLREEALSEVSKSAQLELQRRESAEAKMIERDVLIKELLKRRNQAKQIDIQSRVRPKREGLQAYMNMAYPNLKESKLLKSVYDDTKVVRDAPSLSEKDRKRLGEAAEKMPDAQVGESEYLYYQWVVAFRGKNLAGGNPPIAPDGSIPNSIVWQKMKAFGASLAVRQGDTWTPPTFSEEQLNFRADSDDDGESHLMALAVAQGSESEDEPEPEPEPKPARPSRRQSTFVAKKLSPQQQRRSKSPPPPPSPEPQSTPRVPTPPTPEPEPEPQPEPVVAVQPKRPPLPSFISQFRDASWFKARYPRAHGGTFDFLRPQSTDPTTMAQITMEVWLKHLMSMEADSNPRGEASVGGIAVGSKRRGLLWKIYYSDSEVSQEEQEELLQGLLSIILDPIHGAKITRDDTDMIVEALTEFVEKYMQDGKGDSRLIRKVCMQVFAALQVKDKYTVALWLESTQDATKDISSSAVSCLEQVGFIDRNSLLNVVFKEKLEAAPTTFILTDVVNEFLEQCMFSLKTHVYSQSQHQETGVNPSDYIIPLNFWLDAEWARRNQVHEKEAVEPEPTSKTREERIVLPQLVGSRHIPRIGYSRNQTETRTVEDAETRTVEDVPFLEDLTISRRQHRRITPPPLIKRRSSLLLRPGFAEVADTGGDRPFSLISPKRLYKVP